MIKKIKSVIWDYLLIIAEVRQAQLKRRGYHDWS